MAFYFFRGSTPQVVIPAHAALLNPKHFVGWSPTNTALAIGTSGVLSLRDPRTGKILRQWNGGEFLAWSPDGSALLVHCLPDVQRVQPVRRWEEWALQIWDVQFLFSLVFATQPYEVILFLLSLSMWKEENSHAESPIVQHSLNSTDESMSDWIWRSWP